MKRAALALLLTGCVSGPVVDISDRALYLDGKRYRMLPGYAIGGKPRSRKTPTGKLKVIAKEPDHDLGKALRFGGMSDDGYRQDGRGILAHKTNMSRKHSGGCLCFSRADMATIYSKTRVGDVWTVRE